jgi:hypothetical protein
MLVAKAAEWQEYRESECFCEASTACISKFMSILFQTVPAHDGYILDLNSLHAADIRHADWVSASPVRAMVMAA